MRSNYVIKKKSREVEASTMNDALKEKTCSLNLHLGVRRSKLAILEAKDNPHDSAEGSINDSFPLNQHA